MIALSEREIGILIKYATWSGDPALCRKLQRMRIARTIESAKGSHTSDADTTKPIAGQAPEDTGNAGV